MILLLFVLSTKVALVYGTADSLDSRRRANGFATTTGYRPLCKRSVSSMGIKRGAEWEAPGAFSSISFKVPKKSLGGSGASIDK